MFWHSFKSTLKYLLRQRDMVFWALVFPIILGILFKLAFGNIMADSKFETISVAVNEDLLEDQYFKSFLEELEEEKYFKLTKASSEEILAQDPDIKAYIASMDKIYTKKSGIDESIVETIMNVYLQKSSLIGRLMEKDPTTDLSKFLDIEDHIEDVSRKNMDPVNTFFYTLLGMTTIYGYMWGMYVIYQYEANLSVNAKRNTVAPTKKSLTLSAASLASWLINFSITLIFILYLDKILAVDFGDKFWLLVLLSALSSLTGVVYGIFLGVSNKLSLSVKQGLGIATTMFMSFLAGMMVPEIKIIIAEHLPLLGKINPVTLVTDAVYSLYYYDSTQRFMENIIYLSLITLVLGALSLYFMRGKEYESL